MNISGIGIISTHGRGIKNFAEALKNGWVSPLREDISSRDNSPPAYCVSTEHLIDKAVLKNVRRSDRFSKMAVLAAWDAINDSGVVLDEINSSLGIIVATAFGAHATTFRFLDDILDYGDKNVSPTTFSNSVHNAAGSYIASVLGSHGPTLTLAQFDFPFQQALVLAQSWINEGRCENILVGCVDEYAKVMEFICSQKLKIAEDGKIRPFDFSAKPVAVPGEGSVFFLMRQQDSPRNYCEISRVSFDASDLKERKPDMFILDADGMVGDEARYKDIASSRILLSGYAPIFGSMLIGSGFSCAAAALMLRSQVKYACPVLDSPHAVNLNKTTEGSILKRICCIKYSCENKKATVELEKQS